MKNPDEIKNGLLSKADQRKIAERKDNVGWKNTIVTIQPDESAPTASFRR